MTVLREHDQTVTDRVADRVIELRHRLERTDLRPGRVVDAAFTELVQLCCHPPTRPSAATMARIGPHAAALRALCAAGEGRLERHWGRRIAASRDPRAELARFPYLDNYRHLVRLELGALAALGHPPPAHAVIIGSGPLPLTGLVLAGEYGATVVHVDRDAAALDAGDAVAAAVGLGSSVRSLAADLEAPLTDASLCAELARADVVLVAALVGCDGRAKAGVAARLARAVQPETLLLVRSAARLRALLYPEVTAEDLPALDVLLEVHPRTDVVNSVLVARSRREP